LLVGYERQLACVESASKEKLNMAISTHGAEEVIKIYERTRDKREKLKEQMEQVEEEYKAAVMMLKLMGQPIPGTNIDLTGMTHLDALIAIAKANDNVLVAKVARRLMAKANLFSNAKNASSALFTAINRSGKFERISPGRYKLVERKETQLPTSLGLVQTA
jgi:hypothetical protein